MRRLPCVLLALLAGCTPPIQLAYRPGYPPPPADPPAAIAVAAIRDQRPAPDAARLGDVRPGWGYLQGAVASTAPVAAVLGQAFTEGLAARRMLAPPGSLPAYEITVTMLQLDASRQSRIEATADLLVDFTRRSDGRSIWFDHVRSYNIDAGHVSLDIGPVIIAPMPAARSVADRSLSEVVDQALDNPGLRRALRQDMAAVQ